MKLQDAITSLDSFDRDAHIFACPERPLHAGSTVVVGHLTEDDEPPQEAKELREFPDVCHAKELLEGKAALLKIEESISPDQRVRLFLSVLEDDA